MMIRELAIDGFRPVADDARIGRVFVFAFKDEVGGDVMDPLFSGNLLRLALDAL